MREVRIVEDGADSEHYARTGRLQTLFICACGYRCGADYERAAHCSLPPEFRSLSDWQQEAKAAEWDRRAEQIKAMARRSFDAHRCEERQA